MCSGKFWMSVLWNLWPRLVNLKFSIYHEVLSKSKICMLWVKTCTSFVLFNYRHHIFLLISVLIEKVELLVILCLFSSRKETSQALSSVSVLQNTVDKARNIKKSPKKCVGSQYTSGRVLTYEAIDDFKLTFDNKFNEKWWF